MAVVRNVREKRKELRATEASAAGKPWRRRGEPAEGVPVPEQLPASPVGGASPAQAARPGVRGRIYQPAPHPMQSAWGRNPPWVLEFAPASPAEIDPLTGWTGSGDVLQQVRLTFATKEAAEAYARRQGLDCEVVEPRRRRIVPKDYADNFR